jgi:hypothetical protein
MPYIKPEFRLNYHQLIDDAVDSLAFKSAGDINYVLSSVLWKIFEKNKNYAKANELIGVLECIKLELYRRQIAPYEDKKIEENGDVSV